MNNEDEKSSGCIWKKRQKLNPKLQNSKELGKLANKKKITESKNEIFLVPNKIRLQLFHASY